MTNSRQFQRTLFASLGYIFVIVVTYFFLLLVLLPPYYHQAIHMDNHASAVPQLIIQLTMSALPYAAGGIFLGLRGMSSARYLVVLSLFTAISERLAILSLAFSTLQTFRQVDEAGSVFFTEGTADIFVAIQTEALPYFTIMYIIAGIPIGVFASYMSARSLSGLTETILKRRRKAG